MKKETKNLIRGVGIVLFLAYLMLLVYLLFFSEAYGRAAEVQSFRYNLVPFVEIRRFWVYRQALGMEALYTNVLGNVAAFVPFGFMLPVLTGHMRSGFLIVLSGFCLSLTVETIQLVTRVGCFDVDDLILNTVGAALGYLLFVICNYIRRAVT